MTAIVPSSDEIMRLVIELREGDVDFDKAELLFRAANMIELLGLPAPTPPAAEAPGQEPVAYMGRGLLEDLNKPGVEYLNCCAYTEAGVWMLDEDQRIPVYAAPTKQEPVAVKPLDWVKHPTAKIWRASTLVGVYLVYAVVSPASWRLVSLDGETEGSSDDADAAFSAVAADFEQRIRSALISAPPTYADAEAKGCEPSADEIEQVKMAMRKAGREARGDDGMARAAILAIRSLASPAPKGEA